MKNSFVSIGFRVILKGVGFLVGVGVAVLKEVFVYFSSFCFWFVFRRV